MVSREEYQKNIKLERKLTHKRVELRLPISEYRQFKKIAGIEGCSHNKLIQNMAISARDKTYFVSTDIQSSLALVTRAINRVGDNINQIARHNHIYGNATHDEIMILLRNMDKSVYQYVRGNIEKDDH